MKDEIDLLSMLRRFLINDHGMTTTELQAKVKNFKNIKIIIGSIGTK